MDDSTRLRESRMVFYRDDVARIDASLNELIQLSGARAALWVLSGRDVRDWAARRFAPLLEPALRS